MSKKSFVQILIIILFQTILYPTNLFSQEEISLPHVFTFIDSPLAEQRQVLTSEEIEETHTESLPSLFESMGIQTLSYGAYGSQSNPSIRGFTGGTVRVVVDGVPMNSSQNGNFDFTSINPNDIEKIEVVRGGFTEGLAGEGAVGGVVYITTKTQKLGNHFNAGLGTKTFFNANYPLDAFFADFTWNSQLSENTFFKAGGNFTFAQNRFLYLNRMNKIRENKDAEVTDGNADLSLMHFFGNGNYFSVSDLFYGGSKNLSSGGNQSDYNNSLLTSVFFPALKFSFLQSPLKVNGNLSWKSSNEWYDSENSQHNLNEVKSDLSAEALVFSWLSQMLGFHLEWNHLSSTNTGVHSIFSGYVKSTSKIFLSDWASLSLPLSLTFSNTNFAFVPKLGFRFDLPFAALLLDAYRMISFPNMNQLYWVGVGARGNTNLLPESGWGGEVTFDSKLNWLPLSVCVFTNYYENSIHWGVTDSSASIWTPLNLSSAFYLGTDISFAKTFFEILTLRGNFEYLYNRLLNKNDSSTYGKMIMYTPDIVASLSAALRFSFASFTLEANYTGRRYEDNANTYALSPFLLLNASSELLVWEHFTPYLRADNILNERYESVPGFPRPGFSLTFGLRAFW